MNTVSNGNPKITIKHNSLLTTEPIVIRLSDEIAFFLRGQSILS